MALEDSPITSDEIEIYMGQFDSAHPVAGLLAEANEKRRGLFDETYELLDSLPYNEVQNGNYVEKQAYHQLWGESDIDGTAARSIFISRRRNDRTTAVAWHVFVNDVTIATGSRFVQFNEFVLPVGKRILRNQESNAYVGFSQISPEELGTAALLWVAGGNRCLLYKGRDYSPLEVPETWDIRKFYERLEVTDKITWLVTLLSKLKLCASSFEPDVIGHIE